MNTQLNTNQRNALLTILEARFEKNMKRHNKLKWKNILDALLKSPEKLWSINEMEKTGGEPDVVVIDNKIETYIFCDCSPESPEGRRSLCFDDDALKSRKSNKPKNSAIQMAEDMGIQILTEDDYRALQQTGEYDSKTSSWIQTPGDIRKLGGALFADRRYGRVFTFHNGADSYYASRGFRGMVKII